ncbi:hypothetical protein BG015_006547, partial [Linnemannia schmuckeri]
MQPFKPNFPPSRHSSAKWLPWWHSSEPPHTLMTTNLSYTRNFDPPTSSPQNNCSPSIQPSSSKRTFSKPSSTLSINSSTCPTTTTWKAWTTTHISSSTFSRKASNSPATTALQRRSWPRFSPDWHISLDLWTPSLTWRPKTTLKIYGRTEQLPWPTRSGTLQATSQLKPMSRDKISSTDKWAWMTLHLSPLQLLSSKSPRERRPWMRSMLSSLSRRSHTSLPIRTKTSRIRPSPPTHPRTNPSTIRTRAP